MAFLRMEEVPLLNKRVFFRADLNVPIDSQGEISDYSRIEATLPGIKYALAEGAAVMIVSHLGRPREGAYDQKYSLGVVANYLSASLGSQVPLVSNWLDGVNVKPGAAVLLENCRFNVGEKRNDKNLAERMASICDVFVNDAFASAHRSEASTCGVGELARITCAGPLMMAEVNALTRALKEPRRPLIAIVGGSKVSTKLPVLVDLSKKVDHLIVGGGIANTFLLAEGYSLGKSLVEPELIDQVLEIKEIISEKNGSVPLPEDVICAESVDQTIGAKRRTVGSIDSEEMILDIGPESAKKMGQLLKKAATIVWNGPVGVFETEQFSKGTRAIGEAIQESSAYTIAGGGDTISAINKFRISGIDYISTAGGAFLEFLEGRALPALEVLRNRKEN